MPALKPERLQEATVAVQAYYRELDARLQKRAMKPLPEIRLYVSNRIRRCYGYTAFRREKDRMVVLKIAIAWSAYRQGASMWQDVVAHEAAHAYCMAWHQRADHSPAWQHVARLLGCTGDVYACENADRRKQAAAMADLHPTRLNELRPRDRGAIKLSYRQQLRKHRSEQEAVSATVHRFPQFDETMVRRFLLELTGAPLTRTNQLTLPF